jgi:hypothetical protein
MVGFNETSWSGRVASYGSGVLVENECPIENGYQLETGCPRRDWLSSLGGRIILWSNDGLMLICSSQAEQSLVRREIDSSE